MADLLLHRSQISLFICSLRLLLCVRQVYIERKSILDEEADLPLANSHGNANWCLPCSLRLGQTRGLLPGSSAASAAKVASREHAILQQHTDAALPAFYRPRVASLSPAWLQVQYRGAQHHSHGGRRCAGPSKHPRLPGTLTRGSDHLALYSCHL